MTVLLRKLAPMRQRTQNPFSRREACRWQLACSCFPVSSQGQSAAGQQSGGRRKPGKAQAPPQVERITDNVYRIGAATVDIQARTVTCKGVINMDDGAIEYLAVAPGGKTHESLLRIDVRPLHLQVALMMLDLEPKNVLKFQGDPTTPQGRARRNQSAVA